MWDLAIWDRVIGLRLSGDHQMQDHQIQDHQIQDHGSAAPRPFVRVWFAAVALALLIIFPGVTLGLLNWFEYQHYRGARGELTDIERK